MTNCRFKVAADFMTNCRFKVAADLSVAQPQAAEALAARLWWMRVKMSRNSKEGMTELSQQLRKNMTKEEKKQIYPFYGQSSESFG